MKKFYRLVEENIRPKKLMKEDIYTSTSLKIWDYANARDLKEMLKGTQAMNQTLKYLSDKEIEQLLNILGDSYEEMSFDDLYDLICYKKDEIAQMLGYKDFDEILNK